MNNKKLLIYGSIAVLLLIIAVTILFFKLSPKNEVVKPHFDTEMTPILHGVPSDAIMLFDFKHLSNFAPMLNDTSSFAIKLFDKNNPLVQLQQQLIAFKEIENVPFVYSLHYSAKNSVSFLQVLDLSKFAGSSALFDKIKEKSSFAKRKYNNAEIYTYPSGLNISLYKNLILASNSSYVLESSIRHLETGTSILDNKEFEGLFVENGGKECVYINHRQIGKLFSGEIERRFLDYSDFFLQLSSWSVLDFIQKPGILQLKGYFLNNRDERNFSTIFYGLPKKKSEMGTILPANTIFALSLPLMETNTYVSSLKLFLEVQKRLGKYTYKQQAIKKANEPTPLEWVSSMQIEELVTAYCKFGEKCEWITFIRGKTSFGFGDVISSVMEKRNKIGEVLPFKYKGYIASVFGDTFAECNEEAFCKVGPWSIIGPKKMIEEFNNGNANYYSLNNYITQTPVENIGGKESAAKIAINIKEAEDSVLQIFKPYLRNLLGASIKKNNFEFVTLDITPSDSGNVEIDLSLYATRLKELPKPRLRESGDGNIKFEVDSTIILSKGPFEIIDASVKGGKAFLEQLPNMRLRYLDADKKGVWAIPFETPICGAVGSVDLLKNGKIQMVFISEDRLYVLDKLARFIRNYPIKLPKKVVYGPLVMDMGNKDYTFMVLNEDNSISRYGMDGVRVKGWSDIKAPEFVKELPQIKKIGGKNYWILKAYTQIRIYNMNGKEIVIADKKKKIDRESGLKIISGDDILVNGTDGKKFILNLVTGKTKKVK